MHEARNNGCISNSGFCFEQMGIVCARISPNYNNRKFQSRERKTVWSRGEPVVKTVELVAA